MEYIFFEPRTGLIKSSPIRSNYYVFRLPAKCLGKVQLAVEHADVEGWIGLDYSGEFLEWLHKNDTQWDQNAGLEPPK